MSAARAQVNSFFTPTQISGCQLWLDATDVNGTGTSVANGSTISTWTDKSGNGRNASQATVANRPSVGRVNDRTAIVFSGSPVFMILPNITSVPVSIFMIAASTQNANNTFFVSLGGFPNAIFLREQFSPVFFGIDGGSGGQYLTSVRDLNTHIWSFTLPASASGTFAFDGSVVATSGFTLGANTNFVSNSIGTWNQQSADGNIRGGISEIVMYDVALSASMRQQVEGYLAWKWGLQGSLPSTHPYKTSPIALLLNPPRTLPLVLPATFQPTQISGLALWLDASDRSTITGTNPITAWSDKSGTNRTVTFSGTSTYNSTSRVVSTTSSSFFYANVDSRKTVTTFLNVFIVYRWQASGAGTNQSLWGNDVGGGWNRLQLLSFPAASSIAYGLGYIGALPNAVIVSGLNNGNQLIYQAAYAFGIPNATGAYVNASEATSFVTEGPAQSETSTTNTYFGTINAANYIGTLDFNEILIYTTSITTAQRQQVEGYLAWKWSLQGSLPSTHPYKTFQPSLSLPVIPRSSATASSWSPTQISGLTLWLDASDINGNRTNPLLNSAIATWIDKSGAGKNATQSTPSYRPTYVMDSGYPSVLFSQASTQHLLGTSLLTSTSYGIFFVYRTRTPASLQFVFFDYKKTSGGTGQNFLQVPVNTNAVGADFVYGETPNTVKSMTGAPITTARFVQAIVDSPTNTTENFTINGTLQVTTFTNGGVANIATDAFGYTLGAIRTTGGATLSLTFDGFMNEVIVYLIEPTRNQRQNVEGYLAWKWGLQGSLPANHPFKNWPPAP
jgi:hypothetical protein